MMTWERTFEILRERSTIAGLTGLGIAIASTMGYAIDERVMTEIVLAVISIVAIATRPEKHYGGDHIPGGDLDGSVGAREVEQQSARDDSRKGSSSAGSGKEN